MAWLCPTGVVAMTFPCKYAVEFYQPRWDTAAAHRVLVVAPIKVNAYIPMASNDGLRFTVPDAGIEDTMVALLLPVRFMACLEWEDHRLVFGRSMRKVLDSLLETEFAVALGCYDCSLEVELLDH